MQTLLQPPLALSGRHTRQPKRIGWRRLKRGKPARPRALHLEACSGTRLDHYCGAIHRAVRRPRADHLIQKDCCPQALRVRVARRPAQSGTGRGGRSGQRGVQVGARGTVGARAALSEGGLFSFEARGWSTWLCVPLPRVRHSWRPLLESGRGKRNQLFNLGWERSLPHAAFRS